MLSRLRCDSRNHDTSENRIAEARIIGLIPEEGTPHWQSRHFVLSRLAAYCKRLADTV